ncbi:dystonin isoform X17 [Daktulosphaira vitifoliae]|uniref:dystonin isoform X17 n=1 Tax=Daktulosphaira vitifoliae TaxID=58002 RepID=UPI0021AA418F|nr:dystonin isoform X17 [Daktulosphaira vitifoliae]
MSYYKDRLGFDPDEPVTNGDALKSKRGYEESLCKFKDERDAIQKKTFTKWVNKHLKKHWKFSKENAVENNCAFQTSPCSPQAGSSCLCANRHVGDLFIDLQDGLNLISLLEVLSGDQLPRERGKLRFHMLQNVQMALEYLRFKKIKLVNIRAEDIVDGNPKLTLGLIWTIILHFQISDIVVGEEPNVSARDALLKWARKSTSKYPGVRVSDFTSSWRDGMAFNAIIHRNRPDLVDWRTVKNKTVRERLESAFYTAEREYGVTRLLDPEDVDTHEIDEKSIITYISSLHEVFPDPPRLHPLYDSDSQQRISEYREIATSLNRWMREKLSHMSDRNFPNTLIDMKKLASESTRFRNEELPPRHRDKQHLVHLYKDLQKYFDAVGEVDIEPELQADSIDRTWNRLMMTYQDRDSAIQEEIKRLERLQRLAEKVHREAKRTDLKLDELETRIVEEGRRADRLHPLDAKHNADQLETELRLSEDTIQSLFVDVQALREGRYAQAPELQKRVEKLHQKWVNLRSLLHSKVLTPLASLSFPIVEERTVTKQTRTILETRLVDTNTHFRSLQECIDWCNNKLKQLQEAEYGSDLPSVKALLDQHKREHKLIDQFHSKVEQCINAKSNFHGDELALYSQHLNTLQRVYSDLVTFSNKRLSDLETLQDFLQSATNQLKWLNEKEEIELNRDWSDKDLNIPSIRQYYENLMSELEKREIQLSSVQDRGEALILQGHSASKTIESYITALQTQWTWLLQLTLCLETHLKHATYYHQFYTDVKDAENWLNKRDELLNTVYSQSEFSLDEGERLLKGMQELRDELNNFSEAIATLDERSRQVVPLKQRRLPVTRPITVNAICSYKQNGINVEKGSQWLLHDNSGRVKWRVSRGMNLTDDCNVPGVVFLIPPPDQEALDAIERLRRAYDRTIALWQRKQLRMRQNMIFATIKVVKSWDLAQFLAMGADQRNAIRKALNEDANKLLREGDPADPQLRRLKREMDEVNKLFDEFERLSKAEEDAKNLTRIFNEQAKTIQLSLDEYEHTLNTRLSAPIPRDIDTLEHLVIQHKDFETSLKAMGPEVEAMQATFKKMPNKTHALQAKHDKILNQWNQLWNLSQLYVERLKCAEITLTGIEEANNTISDFEIKLASFGEMPSELPALKLVHEDLIALQKSVLRHQPAIDQLVEDKNNTRRLTEKSRHHLPRPVHHDLDRLDSDVNRIVNRWNNVCSQLVDRLKSCEAAYDLLSKYKNAYQNEVQVVDDNFQKMQAKDLTASTRQAMAEKYKLCDDTLTEYLNWIGEIEDRIANQDIAQEDLDQLRNQINVLKLIKEEIDSQLRPITTCLDQVRHIIATGSEFLSREEVNKVEKNGKLLKSRYDHANDRTDKLLRRLVSAKDELSKFKSELTTFTTWMDRAYRTLEEKERALANINRLSDTSSTESTKDFVSDVIAHQADLRFITMAAQKFNDESKEYLTCLNEFRTGLPSRLPHIEPISSHDSVVKNTVTRVTNNYKDLLSRANALSDKLSGLSSKQREYRDALATAKAWLRDVEPRAVKILNEPIGADSSALEDQLNRTRTLNNEFLGQARLIENVKQAADALVRSLEGQSGMKEIEAIQGPVKDLEDKYRSLCNGLADRLSQLDTALVQSHGVQDALDSLLQWLNDAENSLKNITRPVSLHPERLAEQIREYRLLQSDIDTHRASVDSVAHSTQELMINSSNPRLAKKIENKLKDVTNRFEKLLDRTAKRGELLNDINQTLSSFNSQAAMLEQWLSNALENFHDLPENKLDDLIAQRDSQRQTLDQTVRDGKTLINNKDVTDTPPVRDRVKNLETQWKNLNQLLEEKQRVSKAKAEQLQAYEKLRDQVLVWLNNTEKRVNQLESVAVDMNILKNQLEELKPIAKDHRDYSITIDKLNDLGATFYDTTSYSNSLRRRSSVSPTKRFSIDSLRRTSRDSNRTSFSSYSRIEDGLDDSPVQQELNEINNRYNLLGVRISDRQNELDTIRDEVKRMTDNMKILNQFLDRTQKLIPKESIPMSKEESDKAVRQVKSILEEIYEKQSLLDSTKSGVNDLLRKKPTSLGADKLHDELQSITTRWKSLNDTCKNRIQLLEDLKDFHDSHDNLSNWLGAKERMMNVLGPISSDSRIVQSQVQQLQVLREEFRTQQPQLTHLTTVGESILSRLPDPHSQDAQRLANKLDAIRQKWADLLSKLDERASNLGAAADSTREFDAGLARLTGALQNISDQLDDLTYDKDPEEKLRKIQNLERQLEGQRPLLADLEDAGNHLCDVLDDPACKADIQSKLAAVNRQYNNLQKKLDNKKAEIEGSLKDGRQFEADCALTLGWLSDNLGGLTERLLISADRDILQQQVAQYEPIYKEVLHKEHEIIMLLNKGRDMLSRAGQKGEIRNLQRDLDKIQQNWDKLRKDAVERHNRLQTCMEHCRKYYRALESFTPWLTQAENKLEQIKPSSFNKRDVDKQLRELAAFRNEVWKHSGEYENVKTLGETFLASCDVDKELVKQELASLKNRWDKLNSELTEKTQWLEDVSRKLADFSDNLRDSEHALQRCEDKLASHDSIGGAANDPKLLERIKALREEARKLRNPLTGLRQTAGDLASEAADMGIGDATKLQDDVDNLMDRLDDLEGKLDDRCDQLESASSALAKYADKVKTLGKNLNDLEAEFDALKPPGRDIKTVTGQLDEVDKFIKKLTRAGDDISQMLELGQRLDNSSSMRDQADILSRQLNKLDERASNRQTDLENVLEKLHGFKNKYDNVLHDIDHATDEFRNLKPIGSDVEAIKFQQKEFAGFRKNTIEPIVASVDEVNGLGQRLVQSAARGVNTSVLEKDLEKMNDKWNTLKEKLNERDRRLDYGLLQSGKFQEALDGFAKWLADTEELVSNQKPPSADYKVVKAQLQEQKFLKKMLADRQNSMSSIFDMGNEVAANADPRERREIEQQLKDLSQRFNTLDRGATKRMDDLQRAMVVAKEFIEKLTPLLEWLDKSEKKIKDMELVPTDEEKIQQRIKEHNKLHNEILGKNPEFTDLTEVASTLMALVGEDEASGVADRIQETADRYATLVNTSEKLGQLLQHSRSGLRHLVLTYQDLQAWMEGMENRLNRYKVLPVHTDQLAQQMEDIADLCEEISNKQSDVDGTVDSGMELMKHITSDEAIQLKNKLDVLQRRYNDLVTTGTDLLKNAESMLPLVQQFHNAHKRLGDWMLSAESQLQMAEPKEEDIHNLELDIQEFRPVLENINQIGPQLCKMSPGEGASTIEGLVTRDNRRFDAICEQIQRKAERIQLSKQRSLEVIGDMDDLLDWFREVENQLRDAEPPSSEVDVIRVQLKEHKALNDDISSQKGRGRDVLSMAKKVLREVAQNNDASLMREKMEDLREVMDTVSALSAERLSILEQALPLALHFQESHYDLSRWLDDMERQVQVLAMPALRPELIAQQQDKNEQFIQSIAEHKPLVDKLNKTGEALIKLCNDEEGIKIQDILDSDNARYAALRAELRQRQQALEKALQETSQFSDKLEGMLRALQNTAEQVSGAEPISAHPPKIRDQQEENDAIVEDLNKRANAFQAVKKAANDVINKAPNASDPAVKDIKRKLDRLNSLWNEVQDATNDRGRSLEEALKLAEKFWDELQNVMATLKNIQDSLLSQEAPAVEPAMLKKQKAVLKEIKAEIDQTKPEVDQCRASGQKLMKVCGEPDKPEVKKHIEDLDNAWETVTALFAKCEENLISAMDKAMEFHETLQDLLKFLDGAERRFANLGPLGTDIQAVKKQINELKNFKSDIDPQMVKVEALNRQAQELTERTSAEQAAALKKPLSEVNRRWENLLKGIVERQRQLENSLLHLGQFHHALAELLAWIDATDKTLDRDLKPVPGDSQLLEVELAKLKVLVNDIHAHQSSVDTLNDAGRQLIESSKGSAEANNTQDKLNLLNKNWRDLLQKAADRQLELEDALTEAQRFGAEIQDLLSWLGEIDGVIATSKPVGGLPETASEQLERFMEVYNELESNRPKVETVLAQGQEYLKKSPGSSNLAHNLKILKQRWDSVTARANDKKIKLEIALKEATEFHNALQAFVDWLTDAEKTLSNLKPVSRILPTILSQIEDHKAFQKDVSSHREVMLHLDKKGTHLKYFSQKQDVILIKNLLISVQHRFERVVSKSAERTRALDHGYKEAREFHEAWSGLMEWLNNTEKNLDDLAQDSTVGNDPERIKQRLAKHRDVQRALSAKQGTYDSTMRMGKSLKEKAPKNDEHALNKMINELKEKWNLVCTKSVDRQRKLEEALLYCGQFKDAMEALLDWLRKAEKRLTDDGPVHGDLDTVMALVEQHKAFEETLSKRHDQMRTVKQTGKDLMSKASANDRAAIQSQLDDLESLWNRTSKLCNKRTERLEDALRQAEQLHKSVHMLLEWLSDAEMKLRFIGPLPDNEQETRSQLNDHRKFMDEMSDKKHEKDSTVSLAQNILEKAHPDAINVIKHWITIIQSRWEEVWSWAQQREQKLLEHLQSLQDLDSLLEELFSWLTKLENRLLDLESEPLPESIEVTEKLIEEHREFMENTAKRQSEVDAVCKAKQPAAPAGRKPSILKKTSTVSREDLVGSTHDLSDQRRFSRTSTAVKDKSTDQLPHIGPRFPAKGSKVEEPLLRNSRCRQLWDKWHNVWLMAWERQRRLQEHLNYLKELDKVRNFSWDQWRKRFLNFMNHKKSRLTDLFRKMDKNNDGLIPRDDFIDGIIKTKFDTSKLEMNAVADMFDHDGLGLIDWKEFIAALRPDWEEKKPDTEAEKIHDEVKRLVMLCTCRQKFRVFQVGEGRYRFGDSQKLRLVRILRSTVMVRVGGGWVALDEFLVKNDPCRVEMMPMPNPFMPDQHEPWCPYSMIQLNSKGRTNIELREQFILADGVSQSMSAFKSKHNTQQQQRSGSTAGPITKVRERSARSEPMGKMGVNRTVKTPDSLSDNESSPYSRTPIRKGSTPVTRKSSIGGYTSSLPASRPGSRPQSRQGSKPPSRHGSNLSLDSTDSNTPSRIPRLTPGKTSTARKTNGQVSSRGRSPGPLANQSTTSSNRSLSMHRSSSIPTLSNSSSSRSHGSKIPIFLGQPSSRDSTLPMVSPMSSAPSSGLQSPLATPSSANLSRKPSNASDTKRRNSKPGSDSSREPFRL